MLRLLKGLRDRAIKLVEDHTEAVVIILVALAILVIVT